MGRDLFSERGCVGCHRYEGFDRETDALSAARQNTTQLEEQMVANEKQIREDTEAANRLQTTPKHKDYWRMRNPCVSRIVC